MTDFIDWLRAMSASVRRRLLAVRLTTAEAELRELRKNSVRLNAIIAAMVHYMVPHGSFTKLIKAGVKDFELS